MSTKSKVLTLTSVLAALGLSAMLMPVLFLAVLGVGGGAGGCVPAAAVTYAGPGVGDLTPIQMQRAAAVVSQGRQMGISDQGIVVALATASQESGFRVYANDGKGGDLASDQQGIADSLNLPHDAVGTDHGSLGVFQQQWPWWGTMNELMDPATSARKFYEALLKIPGWESLPVTVAAQRVQSSAYPDAYADDEPIARELLAVITGSGTAGGAENVDDQDNEQAAGPDTIDDMLNAADDGSDVELINNVYVGGYTDCATGTSVIPAVGGGSVVFPLPADSGYVNQNNFGQTGDNWDSFHTGNDFSVACGTPVLAATSGTVEYDDSQAGWAGPNFVRISTAGPGTLATWYAHMETRTVDDGATVTAGQQIGTVGDMGNSRGCHLHFEVHPKGGRIYDDPIDPVPWLASNVGKEVAPVSATTGAGQRGENGQGGKGSQAGSRGRGSSSTSTSDGSRTVVTFNALGDSHTRPGGNKPGWPSSATRTRGLVGMVNATQPDLIGLQEFQGPQAQVFNQLLGDTWNTFGNRDNVIAWRRSAYEPVARSTVAIPYFGGQTRHMPVLTLRDRVSGEELTVVNVHNPADARGPAAKYRAEALRREREVVQHESAAGRAVLLLGDLNDREEAFCPATAGGLLTAANGGSNSGTCTPPADMGIDWILGNGVTFADYATDPSTRSKDISDHPWVSARFSTGAIATTTQTVTLAQANIPRRSGMDGFRASMPKVLSTSPDFVTLNEMFGRSLPQIEAATPGYRGYRDPAPDPGPGGSEASDSVVLWDASKWDFVAGGRVKLLVNTEPSKHGPSTRARYAVWATLQSKTGGGVISVISTHMPVNPGKYGPNQPLRQEQYQQGMQELTKLVQQLSGDGQVLVGGDFNVHDAKGTGVHAQGDDPWAAPMMMSGAGYQWYSQGVDYIFYPAGATASNTTSGTMVSDHPWISAQITLAGGGTVTTPPTSPNSLTVLTYNVDHGDTAKSAGGVQALADEITASGASVVALQDIDRLGAGDSHEELSADLRELSQLLRMQFAYSVNTNEDGQSVLDNAILTKFPIVDAENTDLTGSDEDADPRGLLRVSVDVGRAELVDVYATHLGGDGNNPVDQAEEISNELDEPGCATVLMGDLGSTPGSGPHQTLAAAMTDSFEGNRFGAGLTTPNAKPARRTSYVFHNPDATVPDAQVMPAGLSDQRAARATIDYGKGGTCE